MQLITSTITWDKRFLRVAREVASWSKDPKAQVGAVAIRDRRIIATGYNGFPRGIADTERRWNHPHQKHLYVVHAEQNMIYNATYAGVKLEGCTVYVYGLPACSECVKALIQAGVSRIISYNNHPNKKHWLDSFGVSCDMMEEVGVEFELLEGDIDG